MVYNRTSGFDSIGHVPERLQQGEDLGVRVPRSGVESGPS
jgi:hypothetical protein